MARVLYSLLLRLALPAQVLRHLWRGWRSPQHRGSLRAHLALGLPARTDRPLWLHAASVGEVQGLSPLVRELRRALPGLPLLITWAPPRDWRVRASISPPRPITPALPRR
jgi:3-deoxy-D-manno-octulosonic-acid transferase